jgi:acyl-CoA dehydrogenase
MAAWASSRRPAPRSIYRDARIAAIYEGTNGIQAIDLVTRKLPLDCVQAVNDPAFGATATRLAEAIDSLERATEWLLVQLTSDMRAALAGATPYLRLFGHAAGGTLLAKEALAAIRLANGNSADRIATARFFAENIAVQCGGLETTVTEAAESVIAAPLPGDAA